MPIEIERKFLVAKDDWKQSVVKIRRIRDGLVVSENGRKVRVRIMEDGATLAIKGQRSGLGRREYEYKISTSEAEEILRTMCEGRHLEKVRHYVPHAGVMWEIDVYDGVLEGIVVAEVELDREDRQLELPNWVGEEITGDERYSKASMERERLLVPPGAGNFHSERLAMPPLSPSCWNGDNSPMAVGDPIRTIPHR